MVYILEGAGITKFHVNTASQHLLLIYVKGYRRRREIGLWNYRSFCVVVLFFDSETRLLNNMYLEW